MEKGEILKGLLNCKNAHRPPQSLRDSSPIPYGNRGAEKETAARPGGRALRESAVRKASPLGKLSSEARLKRHLSCRCGGTLPKGEGEGIVRRPLSRFATAPPFPTGTGEPRRRRRLVRRPSPTKGFYTNTK